MVDPCDEAVSAWREECEADAAWDGGLPGGYWKGVVKWRIRIRIRIHTCVCVCSVWIVILYFPAQIIESTLWRENTIK